VKDELDALVFVTFTIVSTLCFLSFVFLHPSSFRIHPCYYAPWSSEIATFTVEVVEIFSFDEIEASVSKALEQRNNLRVGHRGSSSLGDKTAAPVMRNRKFRVTTGPNF